MAAAFLMAGSHLKQRLAPGGEMFFITDGCVLLNEKIALEILLNEKIAMVIILLTYYIIAWWFSSSLCKRLPKGMF